MSKWASFILLLTLGNTAFSGTYYVSTSGSHSHSFDTLAHAATNIESAVAIATNSGDVVLVNDGTYTLASAITVDYPITIKGINGPDAVIIDGDATTYCFDLSDACTLDGLTVTNGSSSGAGGGIHCGNKDPVITNCWVVGNTASYGGGIYKGSVWNSIISGNSAVTEAGGAHSSEIYNSLISGNSVLAGGDWGGGAEACKLYNCTVVSNSAPDTGGADSCDIYNSIIYFNEAPVNPDLYLGQDNIIEDSCSPLSDYVSHGVDGNITNNPVFVNAGSGNYRLQDGSPCKNAGDNTDVFGAHDLDGNTRIIGTVDMGAYEIQGTAGDSDGDGLPDAWEIQYFETLTNGAVAHGDSDIFTNYEEYLAGTDPTNAASYFAITNAVAGSFVVEWPTIASRYYSVLWSSNLTDGFTTLTNQLEHPQGSYTDTVNSVFSEGFYKVKVELKPTP